MAELSYIDYVAIQQEIVRGINDLLPTLTGFPCDYVEVNDLTDATPCLAIAFVPQAYETSVDMVGSFREVTFQLNYKVDVCNNEEKLEAFKALEYLVKQLETLNILTGNDKINLGIRGTTSPSIVDYDETGQVKVFQALYTLNYKQKTRGF